MTVSKWAQFQLEPGFVASCDMEDFPTLSRYCWRLWRSKEGIPYARTSIKPTTTTPRTTKAMHRLIRPEWPMIDHISRNGLDNRRLNLRNATDSQNQANSVLLYKNNTSGYRGVRYRHKRWEATIRYRGRPIFIGGFDDPVEAVKARDAKALELFGQFAQLNFPKVTK